VTKKRMAANLDTNLSRKLIAYAAAASAAGVSLLALAEPSEAEIVYTPAHVTIDQGSGSYDLDLNGDGINDFVLGGGFAYFSVRGLNGNVAAAYPSAGLSWCYASALNAGKVIDFRAEYCSSPFFGGFAALYRYIGQWANVSRKYLGFKFSINGQTHYGWARMSLRVNGKEMTAGLTGYAYETIPNRPIRAGQTSGTEDADLSSLGTLAVGSSSKGARP